MAQTNIETPEQAVRVFQQLPVDERLAMIDAILADMGDAIAATPAGTNRSQAIADLIEQVQDMRQENQIAFLRDVLSEKSTDQDAIALDPHPSKAMVELIPGMTSPLENYRSLDPDARLVFWQQMQRAMGGNLMSAEMNPAFSSEASALATSFESWEMGQQINFLKRLI